MAQARGRGTITTATILAVVSALPANVRAEDFGAVVGGTVQVSIPQGSSSPGCEQTNECYFPFRAVVGQGGAVTWSNDDFAAHTVTSGTPSLGPDGHFDSSLFLAGRTFSHTFDQLGVFPYFCMVHPWMVGEIEVLASRNCAGDVNCDDAIDNLDIHAFILALSDPARYATEFPNCNRSTADVNGDNNIDNNDIDPFIRLLLAPFERGS